VRQIKLTMSAFEHILYRIMIRSMQGWF